MKDKIALGFHGCIDFECVWNIETVQALIREFAVSLSDLRISGDVRSQRDILIAVLRYMQRGIGGEFVPSHSSDVIEFARRFDYRVTIGGTAARAAIAMHKLGFGSALQSCCNNALFRENLPPEIHFISSIAEQTGEVYPHVSLQYPAGCRIQLADGEFTTQRPNRVLFSRDPDSIAMRITDAFYPMIAEAEVCLFSCFSEVLDEAVLRNRLMDTVQTIDHLPAGCFVFMEDGCYTVKHFRQLVHRALAPYLNVLSMNEDEFFELLGYAPDLLNPGEVETAVQEVCKALGMRNLIVHTALWALAYGQDAQQLIHSITCGTMLASTRFRLGDDFQLQDYRETCALPDDLQSVQFCEALRRNVGPLVACVPCKALDFVTHPTTVGLGDYFAGGLAAGMAQQRGDPAVAPV